MEEKSIFISHTDDSNDISGKITYTNILNIIPDGSMKQQLNNWEKKFKTEWRWRFLKFDNRSVVEISFIKNDNIKRVYFNRYGKWVEREIDPLFDKFVDEVYYYYTNN